MACATIEPKNQDCREDPKGTDQSSFGPSCRSAAAWPLPLGSCHLLNYKIWQGINLASPCRPAESGTAAARKEGGAGPVERQDNDPNRSESSTAICRAPVAQIRIRIQIRIWTRIPVPVWKQKPKRKVRLNSYNDLTRSRLQPADPCPATRNVQPAPNVASSAAICCPLCACLRLLLLHQNLSIICISFFWSGFWVETQSRLKTPCDLFIFCVSFKGRWKGPDVPSPCPLTLHLFSTKSVQNFVFRFCHFNCGGLAFVWVAFCLCFDRCLRLALALFG